MRHAKLIRIAFFLGMLLPALAEDSPDFSRYSASPSLRYFSKAHLSGKFEAAPFEKTANGSYAPSPLLLALSFIEHNGRAAGEFFITQSGHLHYCQNVYDWAIQGSMEAQLDEQQMATLKQQIAALSKDNSYPDINSLVIVSFREDGQWITRTCQPADIQTLRKYVEECARVHHVSRQ